MSESLQNDTYKMLTSTKTKIRCFVRVSQTANHPIVIRLRRREDKFGQQMFRSVVIIKTEAFNLSV